MINAPITSATKVAKVFLAVSLAVMVILAAKIFLFVYYPPAHGPLHSLIIVPTYLGLNKLNIRFFILPNANDIYLTFLLASACFLMSIGLFKQILFFGKALLVLVFSEALFRTWQFFDNFFYLFRVIKNSFRDKFLHDSFQSASIDFLKSLVLAGLLIFLFVWAKRSLVSKNLAEEPEHSHA